MPEGTGSGHGSVMAVENKLIAELLKIIVNDGEEFVINKTAGWVFANDGKLSLISELLQFTIDEDNDDDLITVLKALEVEKHDWLNCIPEKDANDVLEVLTAHLAGDIDDKVWDAIVDVLAMMPKETVDWLDANIDSAPMIKVIKRMFEKIVG